MDDALIALQFIPLKNLKLKAHEKKILAPWKSTKKTI